MHITLTYKNTFFKVSDKITQVVPRNCINIIEADKHLVLYGKVHDVILFVPVFKRNPMAIEFHQFPNMLTFLNFMLRHGSTVFQMEVQQFP